MGLITEIVAWFIHGQNGHNTSVKRAEQTVQQKPAPVKKRVADSGDFDLNKGPNVARFLDELKSIEPLSKQFSHAREEMLAELKKLGVPKGPSSHHNL